MDNWGEERATTQIKSMEKAVSLPFQNLFCASVPLPKACVSICWSFHDSMILGEKVTRYESKQPVPFFFVQLNNTEMREYEVATEDERNK